MSCHPAHMYQQHSAQVVHCKELLHVDSGAPHPPRPSAFTERFIWYHVSNSRSQLGTFLNVIVSLITVKFDGYLVCA